MPPPQKNARAKETLEARRARGERACAECRRHKQKCDRTIPCSTCVRRGRQNLCPNSTLATKKAIIIGKSGSDGLRHKLSEMSKRIRLLEDALQMSHSIVSNEPHPLLAKGLLEIKSGGVPPFQPEKESDVLYAELIDSFGTLAVSEKGTESYIGGVNMILADHLGSSEAFDPKPDSVSSFPAPISYLSKTFPFTPLYLPVQDIQALIEEKLPPYARASALVEAYSENLSWYFQPVDREQIVEEVIPDVYRRRQSASNASSPGSSQSNAFGEAPSTDPHILALLLAVFACGAVADLTLAPWNEEGELYYHLARTAVSLKPVFDGVGLHAVQAIALIGVYELASCRKRSQDGAWKVVSFSMSLAASIGLNRDPVHFKLSPKLVQRKRQIFWELYTADAWKSIGSGRPTTFTPSVVDCEFPEDTEATLSEDGTEVPSFWRIRYRFVKEVLVDIVSTLGSVHAVKYSEILSLDRRIRDFGPHQLFDLVLSTRETQSYHSSDGNAMSRIQLVLLKDTSLLLLHRNFFARAMVEDSVNPMRSRFAPSFLAVFRSAASMLRIIREQFDSRAHFLLRLWPIWSFALTAGIMLGSIAACGSSSALASQAYAELNFAITMFMKVQKHPLVKGVLPILLQLREQAQNALLRHESRMLSYEPSIAVTRTLERELEKEFNSTKATKRNTQKGFAYTSDRIPRPMSDPMDIPTLPGARLDTSSSASKAYSASFEGVSTTSSDQGAGILGFVPLPGRGSDLSSGQSEKSSSFSQQVNRTPYGDSASLPAFTTAQSEDTGLELLQPSAQYRTPFTHSLASGGSLENSQLGTSRDNAPIGSSLMNIYLHSIYSTEFSAGSVGDERNNGQGQAHNIPPFAYPSSSSNTNVPNEFFTFYGTNDIDVSGSNANTGYPQMLTQAHLGPQSPFDSWSMLEPTAMVSADFDVNFDMPASMGEEDVLPQDMEAWRAIFQDPLFFGTFVAAADPS